MQVSIDTACSSALVGADAAVQYLRKHGGQALSAGVNLMLAEHTTAATQIAGKPLVAPKLFSFDTLSMLRALVAIRTAMITILLCHSHRNVDNGWALQDAGCFGRWLCQG